MEADPLNLKNVLAIDPKVDLEETFRPVNVVRKGATNKSIMKISANNISNNTAPSNLIWNNITPPSQETVISRALRVKYTLVVTITNPNADNRGFYFASHSGTAGAGYGNYSDRTLINQINGCLRAFPLNSIISTATVRINGTPFTSQLLDLTSMYPHLLSDWELNTYCSEVPCQKDHEAVYKNYQSVAVTLPNPPVAGNLPCTPAVPSSRSPFGIYNNNAAVPSRSCHLASVTGAGPYVYTFEIVEPLLLSPFLWGEAGASAMGFAKINNLTIDLKLGAMTRMLSLASTAGINADGTAGVTGVPTGTITNVVFATAPELLMEYSTLDAVIGSRIPPSLLYDFDLPELYITGAGNFNGTAGANSIAKQCNAIQLSSIPDKLIFFAKPSNTATQVATNAGRDGAQIPDTFLAITGLNITWGNRIALFSTMTQNDLYQMSLANGLKDSLFDFKFGCGSIVIVDVVKDIGLSAEENPSQPNTYSTLQATVTVDNTPLALVNKAGDLAYDIYIVVVKSGKMVLENGKCMQILSGPSPIQVLDTVKSGDKLDGADLKTFDDAARGGSFLSGMSKLINSGSNLLSRIKPEHLELAKKGFELAKQYTGKGDGGALVAGKLGKVPRKRVY